MDIASSVIFAVLVALAAGGLMAWHVRIWRDVRHAAADREEFDFHRRQFRRRMQTSGMLGLLGISVLLGRLLMAWEIPRTILFCYWSGVLLVLAWLALLAVVDVWATKFYFGRLRERVRLEQVQLQALMRRRQAERDTGPTNSADSSASQ